MVIAFQKYQIMVCSVCVCKCVMCVCGVYARMCVCMVYVRVCVVCMEACVVCICVCAWCVCKRVCGVCVCMQCVYVCSCGVWCVCVWEVGRMGGGKMCNWYYNMLPIDKYVLDTAEANTCCYRVKLSHHRCAEREYNYILFLAGEWRDRNSDLPRSPPALTF